MKKNIKQKIWFSIGVLVLSIIFIMLGVLMFKKVPNVYDCTPKESVLAIGGIFSCILGGAGIISMAALIGTSIFEE